MSNSPSHSNSDSAILNPLYPNRALPLADQPPVVLLAMCVFGEARGESSQARRAVAQVIVNRAHHAHAVFGSRRGSSFFENVTRVITRPHQFTCMMSGDVNYAKIFDPLTHETASVWHECLAVAAEALATYRQADGLTHNADHYFDDSIQPPSWADPAKETVKLGRLRFFRLYLPALQSGAGTASPPGPGRAVSSLPSPPASSATAAPAATEALPPSFPATSPPMYRASRHGSSRRLGGRELSSLEAAGRKQAELRGPREASA